MSSRENVKTPVTGVLEGIQGVDLDPLDHEADVVWLPVKVKVCDGDDDHDGEDGVDYGEDDVDDDHDGEDGVDYGEDDVDDDHDGEDGVDDDQYGVEGASYLSLGRCY